MIDTSELRLGNYLLGKDGAALKVDGIDHTYVWFESDDPDGWCAEPYFQNPIPLTEEWLVKFGAIDKGDAKDGGGHIFELAGMKFGIGINRITFGYWVGTNEACVLYIKHVHELQNLIFDHTGIELKEQG